MNSKFINNLKKIRKNNNLSQEQLAEILGISRQAISKWESGSAYPEMEKIIQLCEKFNVDIDDLLHKDIEEIISEEQSKKNLNKYIESFLSYTSNTVNLFCSMNFKSKIKCLFEQCILIIVLCIIFCIIGAIGNSLVYSIFNFLPNKVYYFISNLLESIYFIVSFIISTGILLYLFKTRYLDYFNEISTDENKIDYSKKEEKIIIRDPKHSNYSIFNFVIKLFTMGFKGLILFATFFVIFVLIGLFAGFAASFVIYKTGLFFIGIALSFLSSGIICVIITLLFLNFVFDRKNDKKKIIWSLIISLVAFGIGCGMTCLGFMDFEFKEVKDLKSIEMEMEEDLYIREFQNIEYIEEERDNIKLEFKINKGYNVSYHDENQYGVLLYTYCDSRFKVIKSFIDNLNNKKIINIEDSISDIKVYGNKSNINKIKDNYNKNIIG